MSKKSAAIATSGDEIERLRAALYAAADRAQVLHGALLDAGRASVGIAVEIARLKGRVAELKGVLIDARYQGLIYWEPLTARETEKHAAMMARIDAVLNKEVKP
jgi:hypothetical protein